MRYEQPFLTTIDLAQRGGKRKMVSEPEKIDVIPLKKKTPYNNKIRRSVFRIRKDLPEEETAARPTPPSIATSV